VGEQAQQARQRLPSDAIEVDEVLALLQARVEALTTIQEARDEWEARTDAKLDRPSTVRIELAQAIQSDNEEPSSTRRSARWAARQWGRLPPWVQVLVILGTNVLSNIAQKLLE
jgi:hypothetical protein